MPNQTAPEQTTVTFTADQLGALRALLELVHYDNLALEWFNLLPVEIRQTAALYDIHQLAATIQPGARFRFHPADPYDMPRPEHVLTAGNPSTCRDGMCVPFTYPADFTAVHGFKTGAFCAGVVSAADRFEIVEDPS